MGFFRDRDFLFGLNRKNPKSRGSGSGFENPENPEISGIGIGIFKIPSAKSRKSQNSGFLTIEIFSKFYENPRDFKQSPGFGMFFLVSGFLPRDSGFFFESRDFYSRDLVKIRGIRDFPTSGYHGDFLSRPRGRQEVISKILRSYL